MQGKLKFVWARKPARSLGGALALGVLLIGSMPVWAQAPPAQTPPPPPEKAEEVGQPSTGLPARGNWKFNFDAGIGMFGFANSLYTDVRPDPSGNLGDNWAESFVKPAISATIGAGQGEMYGKVSAVGERTYMAPPSLVGPEASSFQVEDLSIGWRSLKSLGSSENLLDFTVGRTQYKIGHGMLLWDGAGEGGARGGFWSNARKAWQFAAIGRVKPKNNTFEAFYLDRDDVPGSDTGTRLWGANYELAVGEPNTFGASYLRFYANPDVKPDRDGLNVYNLRAYTAPVPAAPDLSFELEYAREENGDRLKSNAWTLKGAYEMSTVSWKPKVSYRYAFFQGDDPSTTTNEGFDSLLPGFYDWGTWWQGEIAGEYFLSNSNLISHEVRVHLAPSEAVGTGLLFYRYLLDQPTVYGPHVTSRNVAFEMDSYTDWKLNANFTVSLVAAYNNPGEAVQQAFDRTKSFMYGMVYLAYSF
jgi:hypothetical protein